MKKLILFTLLLTLLSCTRQENWQLVIYRGNRISQSVTCDSLQMISEKEAFVWVNGTKSKIFGERLVPYRR